jgi:hypothetical protein
MSATGSTSAAPVVHAVLIGVAAPPPFIWDSGAGGYVVVPHTHYDPRAYYFKPLKGVSNDLDSYSEMLAHSPLAPGLVIYRLETAEATTVANATTVLERHAVACTCDVLVIALVGHGFRVKTTDDAELDGMDEMFAFSDAPLNDDYWPGFWRAARPAITAVVLVDSCHSGSIAISFFASEPQAVIIESEGPRRLYLSASRDDEPAAERIYGSTVRGVFTRELENAWNSPINRSSYWKWFDYAGRNAALVARQAFVMTVVGPDPDMPSWEALGIPPTARASRSTGNPHGRRHSAPGSQS